MKRSFLLIGLVATLAGCVAVGTTTTPSRARPSFPGFDTWRYPGDAIMLEWRRSSPYRWVGYYLPSPCHQDASFAGKRSFLMQNGWGIAVIYVGQQLFEDQTPSEVTESTLCTSQFLTAERGRQDGRDAVARAAAEGFPPGTVIFLDIERTSTIPPAMVDYYLAWVETVRADGRYRPGTYAHVSNAAALYAVGQMSLQRAGISESMPYWIAGGSGFTLDSSPEEIRYPFTTIWQGVLDTSRTWGGRTVVIDENVASSPSPSAP